MSKHVETANSYDATRIVTASDGLPRIGFLRLSAIVGPKGLIPVSKSTWWEGVRTGRFPAPVKLGPKTTAWTVESIRALIAELSTSNKKDLHGNNQR